LEEYANEPSQTALERTCQDVYDVIASQQGGSVLWTVYDMARLIE